MKNMKYLALFMSVTAMAWTVPTLAQQATTETAVTAETEPEEAIDPARLAAAQRLVEVIFPQTRYQAYADEVTRPMLDAIIPALRDNEQMKQSFVEHPQLRSVFDRFIQRIADETIADMVERMPEFSSALAHAYAHRFDTGQLNEIASFMVTPAGRAFGEQSMTIMADPAMLSWTTQRLRSQQERLQPIIQDLRNEIASITNKSETDAAQE